MLLPVCSIIAYGPHFLMICCLSQQNANSHFVPHSTKIGVRVKPAKFGSLSIKMEYDQLYPKLGPMGL